jgi:hypothetical protein
MGFWGNFGKAFGGAAGALGGGMTPMGGAVAPAVAPGAVRGALGGPPAPPTLGGGAPTANLQDIQSQVKQGMKGGLGGFFNTAKGLQQQLGGKNPTALRDLQLQQLQSQGLGDLAGAYQTLASGQGDLNSARGMLMKHLGSKRGFGRIQRVSRALSRR